MKGMVVAAILAATAAPAAAQDMAGRLLPDSEIRDADVVAAVQDELDQLGYPLDDRRGVLDTDTRNALLHFQRRNNLVPSGLLTERTAMLLDVSPTGIAQADERRAARPLR